MSEKAYTYVIIGGGVAGASAVGGIREIDATGSVLLVAAEKHPPYHRPPLTKKLWWGKQKLEDIFVENRDYYERGGVTLLLDTRVTAIDVQGRAIIDGGGNVYHYEKLLLATGGVPRPLQLPGADLESVYYYRYLDDYQRVRDQVREGSRAVVIGGGFIGSEIAAALSVNKVDVTLVFPERHLCDRVFPTTLGKAVDDRYVQQGVKIQARDRPASIERKASGLLVRTVAGLSLEADVVVVGIGIRPDLGLAEAAGLHTEDGIWVDSLLQTSVAGIYAAGDVALFPYAALGLRTRVEHWDNAVSQGKWAGRSMAGAREPFSYMPYFYSDLFEFGYEAVGEVDARLETFADWREENRTGVVYYLKEGRVRGAMMCNVWEKTDAARDLIRSEARMSTADLRGAIG
jgi:3-phenylpropionate/trans-cinnamate dioxygenase ferredoxin reductase subunit